MIIKKLELQGFKSFPDRTKIILHPGITAIVGPNGTGKSNIVDGLLWVLGAKRMKSLRGERKGDIIFSGNAKKPPLNMADVNLKLADDSEELIINHRVFRSGEGEYRMNGKAVRLKDIQAALWKKAIGETEYFVIEQGSIGVFLNSKPIEKRLLLEEAAGTAYYKDKKRQTQNKLESSEQNLIRLEDIIDEVLKGKNSLKRQAQAAIRYRKLREKIRELTFFVYREKIENLEKSQKEAFQLYSKSLDQENAIVSRVKAEEKSLTAKREDVWTLEKSLKEEQEIFYSQKTQFARFETEREKEEKRIELLEERKIKAQQNREELKQELISLENDRIEGETSLDLFNKTLDQKQKDQKDASQTNQASQEDLKARQKKIEQLREETFRKLSISTELKNERVKIEKELELILRQASKLKSQLESEHTSFRRKEEKLKQYTKEMAKTQELLGKKQREFEATQKALDKTCSTIVNHQNQIAELNKAKDKDIHHLHALEKLEEKERSIDISSDIPGTLGILADLIDSDAEHSSLIDVFWKEEAKATLIPTQDFLDRLSHGKLKGNFILLSSQKKEEFSKEAYKDKRVIGLLKSHVRPKPEIRDSLRQLHEAAIVQNIKDAVELWIQFPAVNCITLEGDLLLQSGLLKLGQKKEGLFALSQEIKQLKENIVLIDKKITPLELQMNREVSNRQRLEEKISQKSADTTKLTREISEKEKEKGYDQTEQEKIETHIILLEKELSVLSGDRQAMTKKLEDLTSKIKLLEEQETALKKTLDEEEKNLAALRGKNEQERKHYFNLQSSIDIHKEKINNLKHQLRTIRIRKKNTESKITSFEKEIRNAEKEKKKGQQNIKRLEEETIKLEKEIKDRESRLAQDESHLRDIQKEHQEMEERIGTLREDYEAQKEERVQREIRKAERERDLVNLEESCWQDLKTTLKEVKAMISIDKMPKIDVEEALTKANENLQKYKAVNLMAEEEYSIQEKRYDFLVQQKTDLRESIDSTKQAIKKIDQESKTQFQKALEEVNKNFKKVFSILFEGGHAELKLTDPNLPLESGVDIVAQPPGKKLQSLNLLSGGEKSLTSLAFFFALFRYKPTQFCILDEVDAALDETNLSRFLNLMKKIKTQTQFILITHNFKTMEVADFIYGTTMAEPNVTSIYSVKLEEKEAR